ncbi:hypothetical protein PPACK8108_LOCUS25839 [Phakopsora pachyrhizi]|uniref:Uncharacterized protein n=1 Tax=Phakopsora pachyrhizi TaxID=170000 RepID=A0AAV0BY43_PHAPC|nr:hypothetical protein PPACK8108_LOCUS25839 [Phakopsora pachyrhizi]
MESNLMEFIFQKRLSDLNRTGFGFGKTDADEINLMMIKSFETQRPLKLILDCIPRLMLVKDNSDGFTKEKESEKAGSHLREDVDIIMMIELRNVLIPMNYVINPTLILKRVYDQIFHRIYLSYSPPRLSMEQTRRGVGGKTSSKVADKHGKFLGLNLMGLVVVRICWFLNMVKEYYFDLIIKNWKNHITKFFSSSDDNDSCLNPRPERQRHFEERKLIEIVRFVEKSVKELELFLFLDKHKQSVFHARVKVEKLFKNIEEV